MSSEVNPSLSIINNSSNNLISIFRKPPVLGLLIIVLMFCEKMLMHSFTVITLYVLPEPWKWIIPAITGAIGMWLVVRGMGRDEVKGSLLGYTGGFLIWVSWMESAMPIIGHGANIPMVPAADGGTQGGFLGEHVFMQASGVFCIMTLIFIMFNKDVRCRMLLWIRRALRMDASVLGKPTQGYRPNVARVAAFEYFFVTWFMYVLMLVIVDPRTFGLHHPVTYTLCALVVIWGLYLMYKQTQQREVGLSIRYGIGATGVAWFIPECAQFYGEFYEFYLYANKHPVAMTIVLFLFIAILRLLWLTPINEKTQRSL
ncbi:hypothetical protein [Oceanicoccus sp. KOV_DT_Chl]|uniref:hypothetical protein n=1 Tax=Oceanicoccus sp. KOV_DT_Chl TaxID=1904639 RepID=UPI000C7AA851|nr:hypothetical protein [Oceanicoccus sp. KOV_DT_Chl]